MEITSSLVIPVTDAQVIAFSAWANNTYGTYAIYLGAFKEPTMDSYIRTHILPLEMKSVLRETEPYIGVQISDIHMQRLQLYRKRILNKMKYMKTKLGKLAFPGEAAQIRIDKRAEALIRRQAYEAIYIQQQQYFAEYAEAIRLGLYLFPEIIPIRIPTHTIVKKQLSKEEAETCVMDDDCVICLSTHKMTDACTINCGHQFGRKCIAKWKKDTCPLCRAKVTEITEYDVVVADEISLYDQVIIS
jgi:hypothetical protein